MPARPASSAAFTEFGRSSAVSKPLPAISTPNSCHAATDNGTRRSTIVSSTSGTSAKSGATDARAATVIDAAGAARRTSAIAGSAITASPSQFGARMTRRFMVWYGVCFPNDQH